MIFIGIALWFEMRFKLWWLLAVLVHRIVIISPLISLVFAFRFGNEGLFGFVWVEGD